MVGYDPPEFVCLGCLRGRRQLWPERECHFRLPSADAVISLNSVCNSWATTAVHVRNVRKHLAQALILEDSAAGLLTAFV
jgi:hypothetical protein